MSIGRIDWYHVPRVPRCTLFMPRLLAVRRLYMLVSPDALSRVCDYDLKREMQFRKGAVEGLRTACSRAVLQSCK